LRCVLAIDWWPDGDSFFVQFWPAFAATVLGIVGGVPVALGMERRRYKRTRRAEAIAHGRRVLLAASDDLKAAANIESRMQMNFSLPTPREEVGADLQESAQSLRDYIRHEVSVLDAPRLALSMERLRTGITLTANVIRKASHDDHVAGASNLASDLRTWAIDLAEALNDPRQAEAHYPVDDRNIVGDLYVRIHTYRLHEED
jgi:hypothetical protein